MFTRHRLSTHTRRAADVMATLQKLALLSLAGIVCSQGTNFVEFLAPQKNEVVAADTEYFIRWTPKSSIGNGTISLLAGQTSETLTQIREVAHLIDVTSGSFSWPVISLALAQPSNFYAFNLSLDESEGIFDISPLFGIASEGIRGSNDPSDNNQGDQVTNRIISDELTKRNQEPAEKVPVSSSNNKDAASNSSSKHSNRNRDIIVNQGSDLITGSTSNRALSSGAIVGIIIGASTALAIFASLIWLVCYYRRKSLEKVHRCDKGTSHPEKSPCSKESCHPKAIDVECPQMRTAALYELTATREVQEAGGNMRPAELESTVTKSQSLVANVEHNMIYR